MAFVEFVRDPAISPSMPRETASLSSGGFAASGRRAHIVEVEFE